MGLARTGCTLLLLVALGHATAQLASRSLEDEISLIQNTEVKPRADGKQLDLLSGKWMSPDELEDVTHARMQNWVRPGFWVDRVKNLFKKKEPKESSADEEAKERDEEDMKKVAEVLSQLAKAEHPNATKVANTASEDAKRQDEEDFKSLAAALDKLSKVEKKPTEQPPANPPVVSFREVAREQGKADDMSTVATATNVAKKQEEADKKQDEADIASMLGELVKLEGKPAEEKPAEEEKGDGKKVLDLLSGKKMSPEELEDATQARMKNWVRPGFWLGKVKHLIKGKSDEKSDDNEEPQI